MELITSSVLIVVGGAMLFGTGSWIAWRKREHHRRLDARLARGSDAYMDELRSLQAYKPLAKPSLVRLVGALLIAFGASDIILNRFS